MGVLAHLVSSMGKGEPEVTRALAYILNQQPNILQAFVKLLSPSGVTFDPRHRVDTEKGDDDGRIPGLPDMKIFEKNGNRRVLVENKFWANLTTAQPVGYLKMLQKEKKSGLLFVVPEDRVTQVWNDLKTRCYEASFRLGQEESAGNCLRWVPVGANTMLITHWKHVLRSLERVADGDEIRCDLMQFRRLVETLQGSEVFLSLCEEEVKNVDVAQRMINYIDLLNSICRKLPDIGMGITCGRSVADVGKYKSIYRSLQHGGHGVGWLAISFYVWRQMGTTPLWLWMNQANHLPEGYHELQDLFEGVHVSQSGNNRFIPIHLKVGVEQDRIVADAIKQIRDVFKKLT